MTERMESRIAGMRPGFLAGGCAGVLLLLSDPVAGDSRRASCAGDVDDRR